MLRKIRYALEAVVLFFAFLLFRLLPLDMASGFGGLLARILGPFSRAHRTAENNITMAMPELNQYQVRKILGDMWENLGRVIGEYPHLSGAQIKQRLTIEGQENLRQSMALGKGALVVSGHFANWEIVPLTAALNGFPAVLIYRAANNPIAEWFIQRIRSRYNLNMFNKGHEGARKIIKALKEGKTVGILVDQKLNDGRPIPFFGRDAMTAMAAVQLAIKLQVPLLAARVVRTDGAHFHVSVQPAKIYDPSADADKEMLELHKLFESWIREYPAQWFWVHNRWGKK